MNNTVTILIIGLPGVGKSYLSNKITKNNPRFVRLNTDIIRKKLGLLEKDVSFETTKLVYRKMVEIGYNLMEEDKNIIFDATFFKKELRNIVYQKFKNANSHLVLINISCDEKNCINRIMNRDYSFTGVSNIDVYKKIKNEFENVSKQEYSNFSEIFRIKNTEDNYIIKRIKKVKTSMVIDILNSINDY